jgi:hypothetical protein
MEKALGEGFSALRVAVEMKWLLPGLPDYQKLWEIESSMGDFCQGSKCLALCLYDQRRFPPDRLREALGFHPLVLVAGKTYDNIFYLEPGDSV